MVWGKDATILVRPNLVQNEMMVELPEPASNDILLEIYDLQGRLVMTNLIKNGDMALQIDMTTLQTGKYILQANENGAISVIRFMKM